MPKSRSSFPAPARIFLPGCALAAGLLLIAPAVRAAPGGATPAIVPTMTLRVGKTATYPMSARSTYRVESGALNVLCENKNGTLSIKAMRAGLVRVRIETPGQKPVFVALQLADEDARTAPTSRSFGAQTFLPANPETATSSTASTPRIAPDVPTVVRRASSQVIDRAPIGGALPQRAPLAGGVTTTPGVAATPPINLGPTPAAGAPGAAFGAPLSPVAGSAANSPFQLFPPDFNGALGGAAQNGIVPANPAPGIFIPPASAPPAPQAPVTSANPLPRPNFSASATPPINPNQRTPNAGQTLPVLPSPPAGNRMTPDTIAPNATAPTAIFNPTIPSMDADGANNNANGGARISPSLPAPARDVYPKVNYKTTPKLPASVNQIKARQGVEVTQGEARLLTFQNNILSVFFSDPNVMDARAINARTIAVTGTGAGQSTLAVFTERYPGDAVGYASVYRVSTQARGSGMTVVVPEPATVEAALTTAIGDPRIRVSVVKLPEGTLAARLTGIVRDVAEVQGAITTASFFAPRVLPSVYADVNAPSIDAVLSGVTPQAPDAQLQDNLRRITGNSSIELIAMPGSLVLKAEADSQDDAQNLLQLLPTLNQPVIPFVTIRGGGRIESSNIPVLQGEDLQLTQKLQAVTGVRTVYAVRASGNSVAIYGTVQSRTEFAAVKRYGLIIAQSSAPIALQGTGQGGSVFRPQGGESPPLPAYDPTSGYFRQLGVQMFVRILDPEQATVRNVTIETNIVEITRANLKSLGAEYGSATLTGENITAATPGTSTPVVDSAGNPVIGTDGRPVVNTTPGGGRSITRTIDPAFQAGTQLLGNGFAGFGGFAAINPFRARINAIANKTNARVLASPNIRATEGTVAQITIGGERPVPTASASFGSNAQSIEFRRFGVILTMRPTVTDDNTIVLQIRADVTQPDQTYAINLNGAIIPGESVRSIDTTLTVRPGDIVVMGGLLSNDKRQQTSKVPLLGDLPIIGSLFRSKRFENNETELAIFMTPRIDAIPATMDLTETVGRIPSFPPLPSRQESSANLQSTPRQVQ